MIILFVIKQKAKKMCQTQKVFMIRSNYIQSSWSRVFYPYNFNEMGNFDLLFYFACVSIRSYHVTEGCS